MKLLSLRVCTHDSNITYFDGTDLHYYKSERDYQVKHHAFANVWEWRDVIKRVWGVDYRDIDEIAIIFEPSTNNLPLGEKNIFPAIEYDLFPAPCTVWRLDHHYAHSLSGWMLLDKDPDVCITIDGTGDAHSDIPWSVIKNNQQIECGDLSKSDSIGRLMVEMGNYLGLKRGEGFNIYEALDLAGKVMSLQSFGKLDEEFLKSIRQYDMHSVNQLFDLLTWLNHCPDNRIGYLTPLNWARTVHQRVGEMLVEFFKKFASPTDTILYAGGIAQNIVWNTELKKHFPNLIIPPHCADEGLSLGGIEWLRRKNNLPKFKLENFPYIQSDVTVDPPSIETITTTAKLLAEGKIVAWYQGHGELGPRALGNRSILMNPAIKNGKNLINSVKQREKFRPFGASVLDEFKHLDFEMLDNDPFMLYTCKVTNNTFESITHVDGTSRVQTVKDQNPVFKSLLTEFFKITGCPVLLNTSLNVNGKPIANKPDDALEVFNNSKIDCLVIGNKIFYK